VPDFLKQTRAQAAGLAPGGPTSDDLALWESFKSSPEAAAIRAQQAASRLARRRELLAARDSELEALRRQATEVNRAIDAAAVRLKAAETALREAISESRMLPMWAPTSTQILDGINRELAQIADPRLNQLIEWVDFEDETTAAFGPPAIFEDIRTFQSGVTRKVHGDPSTKVVVDTLLQRRAALRTARFEFEALRFTALDEPEFTAAVDKILADIPEIPMGGLSQIGPLPRPLSTAVPNESQHAKQKVLATIATQHQNARAAKASKGWFRK
jgi:hypothetical protein